MAAPHRQRLILPIAPLGAGVAGVVVAMAFLVMPSAALESLVADSGVATLVNAAQPPLGLTARAVLALAGGGGCALLAWIALFVAVGTRLVIFNAALPGGDTPPRHGNADSHPDAPPRQPVFATRDLGRPFLEVRADASGSLPIGAARARSLPANLDVPLSLFDPVSFATPSAPPPASDPIETIEAAPNDRLSSESAPIPIRPDAADAIDRIAASMRSAPPGRRVETEPPASIRALLDRLESSLAQRAAAPPPITPGRSESIREALDALRGLTMRTS